MVLALMVAGLPLATAAVAFALLGIGAFLCALNFYLVLIREPLLKRLGKYDRHVSIMPVVGQVFSAVGILVGWQSAFVFWTGVSLVLADLGGLHVALAMILPQVLFERRSK